MSQQHPFDFHMPIDALPIDALPKLIADYIATRDERLAIEKLAEREKRKEEELRQEIEKCLRSANLTTGGGPHYRATITTEQKPVAENWLEVYKFIKKEDAFDLLQKRLTESAVKARWDGHIQIPGITKFPVTKLSITKV